MQMKTKLAPTSIAVLTALTVNYGWAAEENNEKTKAEEVETIEVTGYRGSVLKSINEKRNAGTIVDSIFAEDIGKNTDQNIADALSRVTGVSVQTEDGEGTVISVRGAAPDLNNISLNGITLTSGGENQAVDLSVFSSDILSSINVYKTSSADHDEGSLGANVVLNTVKPLNVANERLTAELQGRYNQFADETDYKVSASMIKKFFDDRFGVALTVSDETDTIRKDQIGGDWQTAYQAVDVRANGARDLEGNLITEDTRALMRKTMAYELHQNVRERQTINAGFQFLATEDTDIQLDLAFTKQKVLQDNHTISVRAPNPSSAEFDNFAEDPQQDWWVVNTESHTLVKYLNRHGTGAYGRNQGGNETDTKTATLKFEHFFTDNFKANLTAGYSRSDYESLPNSNVNTANWGTLPRQVLNNTPLDTLEPVGYDCTGGEKCQFVVATEDYIYVPGGINDNESNIASGGFNPLDPYASHVGYVARSDDRTTDVNKSVYLDFDWTVDMAGITKIEFGAKISQRDKDVYRGYQQFQGSPETVFDAEGKPINGQTTSDIFVVDILDQGSLPVDDFMSDLVGSRDEYNDDFLAGWGLINADKAFEEIFGLSDFSISNDESASRRMIQDNHSLYGKLNFSYLDDRLTGDIGLRYVHTEVESPKGSSTAKFFDGDRIFAGHELIANGLFDDTNDACPPNQNGNRLIRIDGTYVLSEGEIFIEDPNAGGQGDGVKEGAGTPIDNYYPCYDTNLAIITNGEDNTITQYLSPEEALAKGWNGRSWWQNYRHTDTSTQRRFDDGREQRYYQSQGYSENDMWLPSLNLNYLVSNEVIARFAVSKTMARPRFDDLRPNWQYNEDVWGEFSRLSAPNPNLEPLKSTNLDLSLEWYFDKTGQISLAAFNKDMTDFPEEVESRFYIRDLRRDYDVEQVDLEDLLISKSVDLLPGQDYQMRDGLTVQCMPDRIVQDKLQDSFNLGCEDVRVSALRNGKSAYTRGIEFTYRQTYDFLPGALSGVGTNVNYTFQDSESEAESFELAGIATGVKLQALPQRYTPRHTLNTAIYWEKFGHSLKLTHRFNTMQLVARGDEGGVLWQDDRETLDFSAVYKLNKHVSFTFNALNITDDTVRTFFTSSDMDLGLTDENGIAIPFDEGNPMTDSSVDTSRTVAESQLGRRYRVGVRVNF
ncbi:TonB-dependent receptor [Catenovulum sediminis]|uniref:TonB-dependent receptor n=1 Tax=Catenovulum sediminis TaxID=1740262 RepID=UPI00117C27A8|nr:TonB-dependent receptor [Catenovulum sediminis]